MRTSGFILPIAAALIVALCFTFTLAAQNSTATPPTGWLTGGPYAPNLPDSTPLRTNGIHASSDYANDHTLFAATDDGIFRTMNGGESWELVLSSPISATTDSKFSRVRVSPAYASDQTVFATFYDPDASQAALYRSQDRGESWNIVKSHTEPFTVLELSPAFGVDRTVFVVTNRGDSLLRSLDGGATWTDFSLSLPGEGYFANTLAVSPNYASDQTLFAAGFGPVRQSTDRGEHWSDLETFGPTYAVALSPALADDQTLWASYRAIEGAGDGTPDSSVQRSVDGGETWTLSGVGLPGVYEPFPRMLAASPDFAADRSVFTALGGQFVAWNEHSLFRSYDGGVSWVDLGPAPNNPDLYELVITTAPGEGVRAHLATEHGVWHFGQSCEQRLVNGGFEVDAAWVLPITPYSAVYSTDSAHSGVRSLRAGILDPTENVRAYSSAQQTIAIPGDAASVTLRLWQRPLSGEGDLSAAETALDSPTAAQAAAEGALLPKAGSDRQYVLLLDSANNVLERLLWTRSDAREWSELVFDLTGYAGQTVKIHVGTYNDGVHGVTSLFVDDAALIVCPGASHAFYLPHVANAPTATPTSTPSPTPTNSAPPTPQPASYPTPFLAGTLDLGLRARGVTVKSGGERAYVGMVDDQGKGVIGIVQLTPLTLTTQITLGAASSSINDVALAPDERYLLAAEREAGMLAVVDVISRTVSKRLPVGSLPNGVAVQRNLGYVANFGDDTVTVFDAGAFTAPWTLHNVGHEPSLFVVEQGLGGVLPEIPGACCETARTLYLSAHGSDEVFTLLDAQPVTALANMTDAYGLAYDPAAMRLYVAHRGPAHKISVVDVMGDRLVGRIALGDKEPYVLAVNPDSGHLFVVCDGEVRIFRTLDWQLVTTLPIPAGPDSRIALDEANDRVLVTAFEGRQLSVIKDRWPALALFSSNRDGNVDLYRMLPDGREPFRLTFTADRVEQMAVGAPNSRWIAYASGDGENSHIWIMSRDGHRAFMVTEGPGSFVQPTWSPDSATLAFAGNRGDGWSIYTLSLADGGVSKVNIQDGMPWRAAHDPDWSWATNRIAYDAHGVGAGYSLYDMKPDGSDVRRITTNPDADRLPSWAPDGKRLAFWGARQEQSLFVTAVGAVSVTQLLPTSLAPTTPAWSPEGETILFTGYLAPGAHSEVLRVEANGSRVELLSDRPDAEDFSPGWLPGR
jgi:DNA-binding beta-propeller fold protein YncE